MADIKFLHQPGYLYDLMMIYLLHFNRTNWSRLHFVNRDKEVTDAEFYHNILNEFSDIPDELLMFFYIKDNGYSFLTKQYLFNLNYNDVETFDFVKLRNEISDSGNLAEKLFSFYFPAEEPPALGVQESLDAISDLVRLSEYPDHLKLLLFSFFVNPDKYVQKLIYELIAKEALLSKYYERHSKMLLELQEKFNYDELIRKMSLATKQQVEKDDGRKKYISFCLITKNAIGPFGTKSNFCLIGFDYWDFLNMSMSTIGKPDLDMLGKILSDKNRVLILESLASTDDEWSTSDLAKRLSLSLNATIYHLSMMMKVDMVYQRSEGRTVYYCINRGYFDAACVALKKYSNSIDR